MWSFLFMYQYVFAFIQLVGVIALVSIALSLRKMKDK